MTLNVPLEEHLRPKQTFAPTTPLCFIYNQKLCVHAVLQNTKPACFSGSFNYIYIKIKAIVKPMKTLVD